MREFLKACKEPEFRTKAQKQYGHIKELGITFEGDIMIYWFNVDQETHAIIYDYVEGKYV